ncbi:hypothetical protein HF313_17420 [Massilia atriviolacea]|uniref:SWIM-type domain-containing protein n=1 Tax=Massilia atriviolacea TaxID=2495579 RepID=A0A430HTU7_9BURK|nr:hypothetical protein [Massilia atriviolacea]RSZ60930.1 hypothetical protein EJB06_01985 [Massilia atriviolacea]
MTSLFDWIRSLDDDGVAAWANKGLVRRGLKVLADGADPQWRIGDGEAGARIEGFTQQIGKLGFEHARCDCPAQVTCHHLCAFLLGLRQHLPDSAAEAAPAPADWLLADSDRLGALLGTAALRKALQWLANDTEAELEHLPGVVTGTLELTEPVIVRLPAVGGLAAALCSCRKPACAHRALVVLQARRESGQPIPPLPPVALDADAADRLGHLRGWMASLVIQGWSGSGQAFLDQGEALAMELKQAQMPRVCAALQQLVGLLRQDSGAAQDALAALWMLLRGLQASPLPRPLRELTGVHRRGYGAVGGLELHCTGVERWSSAGGHHGFSLHFWAPARQDYLVWSEVRQQALAPEWDPDHALMHADLGGLALTSMLAAPCVLASGWVSGNGRLSGRDGTRVHALAGELCLPLIEDLTPLIARMAADLHEDPWRVAAPAAVCIGIARQEALQGDRGGGAWSMAACDAAGNPLRLQGGFDGMDATVHQELHKAQRAGWRMEALFGYLRIERGALSIRPVSVRWSGNPRWRDLSAPWLRADKEKKP